MRNERFRRLNEIDQAPQKFALTDSRLSTVLDDDDLRIDLIQTRDREALRDQQAGTRGRIA